MEPITSIIFTWEIEFTSKLGSLINSSKSKGVPKLALYLPAKLLIFVGSTAPKASIWILSWVKEVDGNLKKSVPLLLTSTNPSSRNVSLNAFSKIAKSHPGPFSINLSKLKIASPPSPKLTIPFPGVPIAMELSPALTVTENGFEMSSWPTITEHPVAQLTKILLSLWTAVVPWTPAAGANWANTGIVKNNSK